MNNDTAQQFINFLQFEIQLAQRTVQTYGEEITRFIQFFPDLSAHAIQQEHIEEFIIARRSAGLDERTISKIISSLRRFFSFLIREGICTKNPCQSIELPRPKHSLPSVLSIEEIESILEQIDVSTALGLRDRAMFELIYSCGLRISEAVELINDRIYFDESLIRIFGKGNKERIVPMGEEACYWLSLYMKESRPQLYKPKRSRNYVFLNHFGGQLSRKGIWKRFSGLRSAVGIQAKVHTLRHSFATHLLAGGADIRSLQALLGHADIGTTEIYTHIDKKELQVYHTEHHPRSSIEGTSHNYKCSGRSTRGPA